MKNIEDLLVRLRGLHVTLREANGKLAYEAPAGALTPEILAEMRERKGDLLALLRQGSAATQHDALRATPHGGALPVSPAQRRLWFLCQLEGGNVAYNMPFVWELTGPLDAAALARSLGEIVRRHESLRTTFRLDAEGPMQVIHPAAALDLPVIDLGGAPEREAELTRRLDAEAHFALDLERGPLLRARLFRLSPDHHFFSVVLHHIVGDGWSLGVFVRELAALYEAHVSGRPSPLPELPVQYADWSRWQQERFAGSRGERHLAYWRQKLAGLEPLRLPTDLPRPALESFNGDHHVFSIDRELTAALREMSREEGVTLFVTLLAAFEVLLGRCSGQSDVALSTGMANRKHPALEGLIGFFVNTVVIRCDLSDDPAFQALLRRVHAAVLEAGEHEDIPFERVVEDLRPERAAGRSPLVQAGLSLANFASMDVTLPGLQASAWSGVMARTAKADLLLMITDIEGRLDVIAEYNRDLFERRTVERLSARFEALLRDAARDRRRKVTEMALEQEIAAVEHVLCASARVQRAAAVRQGGAPRRLVAYVTPVSRERSKAWELEQVAAWQALSRELDVEPPPAAGAEVDPTLDLRGWKSSFTGEDIPLEEMRAWADSTAARILDLAPRDVLEIGCGTGLMAARIAPHVQRYRGTDLARHAITRIDALRRSRPGLAHLHATQQPAHDLGGLGGERFDTVILNSVVQYFPSADYLVSVIGGVLELMPEQGAIFLGDVRHLALLETFHAAVESRRAGGALSRRELGSRVRRAVSEDKELVLHPRFFTALRAAFPRIVDVEIAPKRGAFANELSLFRYDVTLRIGAEPEGSPPLDWRDVAAEGLTFESLRDWLVRAGPGRALGLRNLANARLRDGNALARWLAGAGDDGSPPAPAATSELWDPEALHALERQLPCRVHLSWAEGRADGSFDAIVTASTAGRPRFPPAAPSLPARWADLASDPLQGRAHRELSAELSRELRAKLPPDLVPQAIVVLPEMPLTGEGNVDVEALPPPAAPGGRASRDEAGWLDGEGLRASRPVTGEERQKLVVEWNRTETPFSSDACVHHLFEAQVERAPDAVALVDHCDPARPALTYGGLDRRANRVAHRLQRLGVGPERLVGVCLERGADLITGLLGVLKAGGAAVVLDPEHPKKRLERLLADTGVKVLLTRGSLLAALPETRAHVVDFDRGFLDEPAERPRSEVGPRHLAYVLYTSGSTGDPNGVLVEHRGLVNSTEAHIRLMEMGPGARFAHVLSFNFDAAMAHLFSTICAGGALHLAPRDLDFLGAGLLETMEREAVTHTCLVPSMLSALPGAELPALTTILAGGERCPAELVTRWGEGRRFLNVYGPTEASILATYTLCAPDGKPPPIGRPIGNMQAYVVDDLGQLVPPGEIGELWLGGVGVARGYLNRPALTARKFIESPFGAGGGRLYRTGDRVRHRVTGGGPPELEFVGRADDQVKIRGHRVELAEVESALRASPRVRDAVATVHEGAAGPMSRRLVAHVTPASPEGAREGDLAAELRRELRESLPEHMVPSAIVVLPALPLTPNGKVDRRALPAPAALFDAPGATAAPRSPVERQLAEIWCQALGLATVGRDDDFFELGGHSLLAVTVMTRVEEELGRRLPVSALFRAPTIQSLARLLAEQETREARAGALTIPVQPHGDRLPVFWITGFGVHIVHVQGLARRLGPDQPFHGIQPSDIQAEMPDVESVRVLVERLADAVQAVQRRGPYVLCGHSAGARLALPLAVELEARGQRTTLVVVDMTAPRPERPVVPVPSLALYVQNTKSLLGDRMDLTAERLQLLPEEEAWQVAVDSLERAHYLPAGADVALLKRLVDVDQRIQDMVLCHVPAQRYAGRLALLQAAVPMASMKPVRAEDWQRLCMHPVETFLMPGNHLDLILEPNVGDLAARLRLLVDEAREAPAEALPVIWDDPEDARSLWLLDEVHDLRPMTPLDFDLRLRPMVEGNQRASRGYGVPQQRSEPRLVHSFVYQRSDPPDLPRGELSAALEQADAAVRRAAGELGGRWASVWLPEIEGHLAALTACDLPGAPTPALRAHLTDTRDRLLRLWEVHFELLLPVMVALSDLEEAYRDLFPDAPRLEVHELLSGFPNKTTEANARLWALGRRAAQTPALRQILVSTEPSGLAAALARTPEGRALWGAAMDHVRAYGERNDDLYIDCPTWIDDPTPMLQGLRQAALQPDRDLAAELSRKAEQREARWAEVKARLASHPRPVIEEFESLLRSAQIATVLGEDHHFWLDCKITHHARRVSLEVGRRLVDRGVIEEVADVFQLTLAEVLESLQGEAAPADRRARVAERRAETARFAGVAPPRMLGVARPMPAVSSALLRAGRKFSGETVAAPEIHGELRGMPGSGGKVTGPARIVRTLGEAARLRPGDILVAPATLPSWTPFFATVAAVVTNTGGILSHAAVVAREYGIAAVVGARGATETFREGQILEIDGDAGVVRALS